MTNVAGTPSVPVTVPPPAQPTAASPATNPTAGTSTSPEKVQISATAKTAHKTLADQLRGMGTVDDDAPPSTNVIGRFWNWLNQPKVEAGREFASALVVNAPSLMLETSKRVVAGQAALAVSSDVAVSGASKVGAALTTAGTSGIMETLARVGPGIGAATGVVSLLRDLVKGRQGSETPIEHDLIIGGGFMAVTGATIALLGGALPGAVIGLIGTLFHATGLFFKSEALDNDTVGKKVDPTKYS